MENRKRKNRIHLRFSDEEYEYILNKFKESSKKNFFSSLLFRILLTSMFKKLCFVILPINIENPRIPINIIVPIRLIFLIITYL